MRTWTSLPKSFAVARVDTPADRKLTCSSAHKKRSHCEYRSRERSLREGFAHGTLEDSSISTKINRRYEHIYQNDNHRAAAGPGLGCASAKYIDEGGDDSIVNVGQINTQDWIHAADQLTQSLLLSGGIQSVAGKPNFDDRPDQEQHLNPHRHRQPDEKNPRGSINGRALTTTAVGLDGPEDASSKAVRELRSDDEFNQETIPDKGNLVSPDYNLSGKIIQNNAGRAASSSPSSPSS